MSACADTRPDFLIPTTFSTQGTSTAPPAMKQMSQAQLVTMSDMQQLGTSRWISVTGRQFIELTSHFHGVHVDPIYVGEAFSTAPPNFDEWNRVELEINQWIASTRLSSSLDESRHNPHFATIKALGWSAVRSLLNRMSRGVARLQCAELLEQITGEDPVNDADLGNARKIGEAWLNWGRARGFA